MDVSAATTDPQRPGVPGPGPEPHLRHIEMLHLPDSDRRPVHRHDFAELVYVVKGNYFCDCEGEHLSGNNGAIFYYPAGLEHRPGYASEGPTQLYILQWDEGRVDPDRPRQVQDDTGRLLMATEWLWELHPLDNPGEAGAARGLFRALLHQHRHAAELDDNDLVRRLRHKMLQDLSFNYDLDTIAMVAGYSKFHFVRLWKQLTGSTPMKFLQELRVKRAIQLLHHTDLALKQIAAQVGFANVDYLSRLVRKETGRTPTQIRRGG